SAERRFYLSQWQPFTLLNTGNVNLAHIKPELALAAGNSTAGYEPIGLPSDGTDPFRSLTLFWPPVLNNGAAGLRQAGYVFLRASFDRELPRAFGGAAGPYLSGPGPWLQKAPVGAAAPGAVLYQGDPKPTVAAAFGGVPGGLPIPGG